MYLRVYAHIHTYTLLFTCLYLYFFLIGETSREKAKACSVHITNSSWYFLSAVSYYLILIMLLLRRAALTPFVPSLSPWTVRWWGFLSPWCKNNWSMHFHLLSIPLKCPAVRNSSWSQREYLGVRGKGEPCFGESSEVWGHKCMTPMDQPINQCRCFDVSKNVLFASQSLHGQCHTLLQRTQSGATPSLILHRNLLNRIPICPFFI